MFTIVVQEFAYNQIISDLLNWNRIYYEFWIVFRFDCERVRNYYKNWNICRAGTHNIRRACTHNICQACTHSICRAGTHSIYQAGTHNIALGWLKRPGRRRILIYCKNRTKRLLNSQYFWILFLCYQKYITKKEKCYKLRIWINIPISR